MKMKILAALFITVFLCLIQAKLSNATIVKRMTIEEMTTEAEIILEGKVTSVESEWNYNREQIHTFVTVEVDEFVKGDLDVKELKLRLLGGTVGDTTMLIIDSPIFVPEEEVFLFLRKEYRSFFPVEGLYQGKFHIETDPNTGEKVLRNELWKFLRKDLLEQVNKILLKK